MAWRVSGGERLFKTECTFTFTGDLYVSETVSNIDPGILRACKTSLFGYDNNQLCQRALWAFRSSKQLLSHKRFPVNNYLCCLHDRPTNLWPFSIIRVHCYPCSVSIPYSWSFNQQDKSFVTLWWNFWEFEIIFQVYVMLWNGRRVKVWMMKIRDFNFFLEFCR